MLRPVLISVALCACLPVNAQAVLQEENFETDGNGSRYSTSVPEFADGEEDYFSRTDGSGLSNSVHYLAPDGSFYFAAQDTDAEAGGAAEVSLTVEDIDITGATGLEFSALFAEDDAGDGNEDWDDGSDDNYVRVYGSIDGGVEVLLFGIEGSNPNGSNGSPRVDTDLDGVGDGAEITETFASYGAAISGTGSSLDLRFAIRLEDGDEDIAIDRIRVSGVTGGGQAVTLTGGPADGGDIAEAGGSTPFIVTLNTSDGAMTEAGVTGQFVLTQGSNTTIDFNVEITEPDGLQPPAFDEDNPYTFAFPAGTDDGETISFVVTAASDAEVEGTESFQIEIQNVSGASLSGVSTFDFDILDDDIATGVTINEIAPNQEGIDTDEFFELKGPAGAALDGLTYVVLGADGTTDLGGYVEEVVDLVGSAVPSDGYFLAAESSYSLTAPNTVDLEEALNFQNGTQTHLLVSGFTGSAGDDLDTDNDGHLDVTPWTAVIDAVAVVDEPAVAGMGDALYYAEDLGFDNVGPAGSVAPGHIYRNESPNGGTFQIGSGSLSEATPGAANPPSVEQSEFADSDGYRLLSLPITTGTGADLAEVNLVQGASGQYEDAEPNIYVGYNGSDFIELNSTASSIEAGKGFFWYLFDIDFDPADNLAGGGTSRSHDLAGYTLSLSGTSPTGSISVAFTEQNGDHTTPGLYMIGNPFSGSLDLSGVALSAGDGTLSQTFQAYDGNSDSYVALISSDPGDVSIGVFQGVFACVEYDAPTGVFDGYEPPTFTITEVAGAPSPTFYWRRAAPTRVGLELTGDVVGGRGVYDGLADLHFHERGAVDRDPIDAAEIPTPSPVRAALALVEDGVRRAVRGVPLQVEGTLETPVAFFASHPGTFTVSFDPDLQPPAGLAVALTDLVTGQTVEPGQAITFESGATGWAERFVLTASGTAVATEANQADLRIGTVYPNPTAGAAHLSVEVDAPQRVRVTVYDALGRAVATPLDADLTAGAERLVLMPDGLAQGTYVVRVAGETFVETRRLSVLR